MDIQNPSASSLSLSLFVWWRRWWKKDVWEVRGEGREEQCAKKVIRKKNYENKSPTLLWRSHTHPQPPPPWAATVDDDKNVRHIFYSSTVKRAFILLLRLLLSQPQPPQPTVYIFGCYFGRGADGKDSEHVRRASISPSPRWELINRGKLYGRIVQKLVVVARRMTRAVIMTN